MFTRLPVKDFCPVKDDDLGLFLWVFMVGWQSWFCLHCTYVAIFVLKDELVTGFSEVCHVIGIKSFKDVHSFV